MAKINEDPKFIIYKAENGWSLYIPKDESIATEYGGMVSKMMGQFGLGGDPILERAKEPKAPKIHGLFLFEKFEDLVGFIRVEFEQEVEKSNKLESK